MKIELGRFDHDAVTVVQRLRRADHQAYLVGGCVRDLLLGRKPKDFDIATSATPQDIRRLFRNCRIIGRRFRLAHVFFGQKIIETATFRANPRELDDEEREESAEGPGPDLLIRRDNVFGTAEEDARRRDFTINGLFYDVDTQEVIDHVAGLPDIEAKVVRTIGDPDIRFREDPIRILRAVKFAARCELTIDRETHRRMQDHAAEILKSAPARVSEEFFRLLRAGAARHSMELLIEYGLLGLLLPSLDTWLRGEAPSAAAEDAEPGALADGESLVEPLAAAPPAAAPEDGAALRQQFWQTLTALDECSTVASTQPSNAVVLSCLFLPTLRRVLDPEDRSIRDLGSFISQTMRPVIESLRVSRRDSESARQLLLVLRHVLPAQAAGAPRAPRRRPRMAHRDLEADFTLLLSVVARLENLTPADLVEAAAAPQPYAPRAQAPGRPVAGDGRTAGWTPPGSRAPWPIPELPPAPPSRGARPRFLGTGSFGAGFGGRWGDHAD